MGSFRGHALPGSFFMFFAIWQAVDTFCRYFHFLYDPRRRPYENRASIRTRRLPLEAILKLCATTIGFLGELYTGFDGHGHFTHVHNGQHMTMFAFFGLNAIFDLLYFYKMPGLPPKLDYLSAVLAFSMEGMLFMWHLHGRSPMDIQVHTFLTYAIFMCIVGGLAEMARPHDVRAVLIRITATFVQGTWFWQVGFILYPKIGGPWKQDDHTQMLIVTMIFTWHVAASVFVMFLIGFLVFRIVQKKYGGKPLPDFHSAWTMAFGPGKTLSNGFLNRHHEKKQTLNGTEYFRLHDQTQSADGHPPSLNLFSDEDEDNDDDDLPI